MTILFTFFKGLGWSFFLRWDFVDGIRVFTAFLKIRVWKVIFGEMGFGVDNVGSECLLLPYFPCGADFYGLPLRGAYFPCGVFGYNLFFKIRIMG